MHLFLFFRFSGKFAARVFSSFTVKYFIGVVLDGITRYAAFLSLFCCCNSFFHCCFRHKSYKSERSFRLLQTQITPQSLQQTNYLPLLNSMLPCPSILSIAAHFCSTGFKFTSAVLCTDDNCWRIKFFVNLKPSFGSLANISG